ncbi:unnamed protein product [Trifolium pratense]|uniref:Uncharacterized protein n=1 Tax=Trifolium pratense TaxID=57577 RepID=A0ACB0JIH7_TRIPR|nr:unnamed protein product [Trifolium pratense]
MKPLLESVGSSFCPDHSDWSGTDASNVHSRNADKSVLRKFLQAHPTDYSSKKLQEIIWLMREKRLPAAFKCYHNFHKVNAISKTTFSIKWPFMCIVILFFGDTKMR